MQSNLTKLVVLLLLTGSAFGLTANLNDDCMVNLLDYAIFAADWQESSPNIADPNTDFDQSGTVDINDLLIFADQWLDYEDGYGPPTASDVVVAIDSGDDGYIELSATDPNNDTLVYSVVSLPDSGSLYDPNGVDGSHTDPNSGHPDIIAISSVPYELVDGGYFVLFTPDISETGETTFAYSADDGVGMCGGSSNTATVTIYLTSEPLAFDSNEAVVQYEVDSFELFAVDNNDLTIDINSLADGLLKDPLVGAMVLDANVLPWELRRSGDDVLYTSDTVGTDSFNWYATGGGETSNVAEVNITVYANPMDALYLDGDANSFVTIPDNSYFDIADTGWAVSFWFNNFARKPYQTLISKRDGGPGWEIAVDAGKLRFDLYDASGLVMSHRSDKQVSDGYWWPVLCSYIDDPNDPNDKRIYLQYYGVDSDWCEPFAPSTYANDANLVIATNAGVDHLRFWDDSGNGASEGIFWPPDGRSDYVEMIWFFGNPSNVRYKMDEGTGATISDDKAAADDGVFQSGEVLWHPPYSIFHSKVKH